MTKRQLDEEKPSHNKPKPHRFVDMSNFEREQLLGYLLDALDDAELDCVQERLKREPDLRAELAGVGRMLRPLHEARIEYAPPRGLAERTCLYVTLETCQGKHSPPEASASRPLPHASGRLPRHSQQATKPAARSRRDKMNPETAPPTWRGRFRLADAAVSVGVVVLAAMLILPAIGDSRFNAQVEACKDRLRNLGVAMNKYSENHNGYFPRIAPEGRLAAAGMYAPMLSDDGLLADASDVICPGSSAVRRATFRMPTVDQLQAMPDDRLAEIRPELGGSYGYNLGYVDNGRYRNTKNLGRSQFAIMSDSPGKDLSSSNHAGRGQNILFEDGRVEFLTTAAPVATSDNFFTNDRGQVAAGVHVNDSVIGASATAPIVYVSDE